MNEKYIINDICDVGSSKRIYLSEYQDSGIPFYRGKEIIEKDSNKEISNELFISQERYNEIKEKFGVPKKGDILMTAVGTIGISWYVNEEDFYFKDGNLIWFKNFKKDIVNSRYLYYIFKSKIFSEIIKNISIGSTQKAITIEQVKKIELEFPKIEIQNKIVKILDNISNKIKLNNEINNNLYELSQKIYNRWFVDFEYPISSNQTYKSNGGSFKEVDGLVVPDNFIVNKLDEICDCQNGHAFYKEGYDDSGLMVIDLGNVSLQGNFIYTNADKYIDRNRIPNEKFIVKKNDLVMIMTDRKATMDLLGKTAKIYEDKEYALNQRIYRIRPTINVNYVYSFLNSSSTLEKLKGLALGSVQKYVNTNHINDLKIVVPSAEIMNEYSKVVDPVFKRMEENILENRNLEIMRDSLLPKLMNGEIDLDNIKI